ncbi:hypothetical protein LWI28_010935 [Acer negundo]|uniref:Uncharacterized protein n=1 Tax=Acer negundo TaxID=4023 RepID=A0AAD5NTL9_ACENE|nr:hypothetical protein LWI28_010935 [Acer negundo]
MLMGIFGEVYRFDFELVGFNDEDNEISRFDEVGLGEAEISCKKLMKKQGEMQLMEIQPSMETIGLAEEFSVGEALTGDYIDERGGGARAKERDSEFCDGDRLRRLANRT